MIRSNSLGANRFSRRVRLGTDALTTSAMGDALSFAISMPVMQSKYFSGCFTSSSRCDKMSIRPSRGIREKVTAAEAKNYIDNAPVSVTRWNGRFEDYFSHQGAAYVDMQKNEIRTAYSSAEFDEKAKAIMEVLKKNGK